MIFEERPDYKSVQILFPGNRMRDCVSGVFLPPGPVHYWETTEDSEIRKEYNKNLLGIWYYGMDPMHVVTKLDKYVLDIAITDNNILYHLFLNPSRNVTKSLCELASHAEKTLSSQIPKIDEIYNNYKKVTDGIEIQKPYEDSIQYLSPMMIDRKESPVDHLAYLKSLKKPKIKKGLIMDHGTLDKISGLLPHIIEDKGRNYIFCKRITGGIDLLAAAYEVWPDAEEHVRLAERTTSAKSTEYSKPKITS